MHLKCHRRFKDGKEHRYWSIVESRRCASGRVVQRHALYLGEINDSRKASWLRCIEAFDPQARQQVRRALFPDDRPLPAHAADCGVLVRLRDFAIRRSASRARAGCFCNCGRNCPCRASGSRKGTTWYHVLVVLCAYRLLAPGSEFDFVFIDALKKDKYFQTLSPKLKRGALVVADKVIRSANDMKDFLDFMESSPDYEKITTALRWKK